MDDAHGAFQAIFGTIGRSYSLQGINCTFREFLQVIQLHTGNSLHFMHSQKRFQINSSVPKRGQPLPNLPKRLPK